MVSLAPLRNLSKRLDAVQARRHPVRYGWCFIEQGECPELVASRWRLENNESADIVVRCILTGIPGPNGPNPDLCTRESVAQALPELKEQLTIWAKSGVSDRLTAMASHWQDLCIKFHIEDEL